MRLIGYIRVSRVAGREGETFISPAVQRERIEAQAKARGHTVVEWFEDLDQPGSKFDRPGFQSALEAVEGGAADGVIVAKLDRFARSTHDAEVALRRLENAGGTLISVDDALDTSTPMGEFARSMMLAIAQLELARIRESWAAAGSHAADRGVHVCRVAPAGYRKAEDGRLEPDPIAAPVIRELFQRRGAGEPWSSLCDFLDERLPRENGDHWSRSTVTSLIARRTYLGEARGGGIVNTDAHPPLVTRGEFEAAQVAEADGRLERGSDGGALLVGLLRCGSCGHTLTRLSDGARGYSNYKCRKRHRDGVCEAPVGISVSRADGYVEGEFLAAVELEPVTASGQPADGTLVTALEAAEGELAEYRDLNLVTVIGRDAYVEGLRKKQDVVDAARRKLGEANASAPLAGICDLGKLWPDLGVRERRHLLGSVLDHAVVTAAPGSGRGAPVSDRLSLVWR